MFEKLKKKYKLKCILGWLACWAAAAVIVGVSMDNIKVFLSEPVQLESLDASNIQGNLRVDADIYYVMDYYSYMEKNGSVTSMEFMIPVGEVEFMGMECSGSKMREAKANMEVYWDYADGKDVDLNSLPAIHVTGTIQPLKGESLRFYNEFIRALDMTDEDASSLFLPYVLKVGNIGDADTGTAVIMGLFFAALFIGGIWILISGLRGSNLKEIEKYCATKGNKEYEMQKIEQFYQTGESVQGIRAGSEYLMAVSATSIFFAPADKLLWVYTHVVQHRTNFIPTGKTYSVMVKLSDGKQLDIPMKNQSACDEAMNYLSANYPYLYIGYDDQWNRMYNKNRDEMSRLVWGRKTEMPQNMNGAGDEMN